MSAWSTVEHLNMEQRPSRGEEDKPQDQQSEEGSSSDSDPEDQGHDRLQVTALDPFFTHPYSRSL